MGRPMLSPTNVARAQGLFNILGGAWPLVSLRTFEFVYGKKRDIYLQKTVGALLLSIGIVQSRARGSDEELVVARSLGIATALSLLAIDLIYIPKHEMRWTYWQDAACEVGWIAAWIRSTP